MRFVDLTCRRFGRLTVTQRAASDWKGRSRWFCKCDCGVVTRVTSSNLRSGNTKSCGCLDLEKHPRHPLVKSSEHNTWCMMWQRCTNRKYHQFHDYGGRGIAVCDRWKSFASFIEDMGRKPAPGHSIERKDNNLGYSPDNCCWATATQQAINRRPKTKHKQQPKVSNDRV